MIKTIGILLVCLVLLMAFVGCAADDANEVIEVESVTPPTAQGTLYEEESLAVGSLSLIEHYVRQLTSHEFAGRMPGTLGNDLAVRWLSDRLYFPQIVRIAEMIVEFLLQDGVSVFVVDEPVSMPTVLIAEPTDADRQTRFTTIVNALIAGEQMRFYESFYRYFPEEELRFLWIFGIVFSRYKCIYRI
ncbi:MAG: hypothetical protein FWC75_03625 [Oscillospiraceae bacterium]|nr:hypothetical protein [Oscillospiraceae bacterium]